MKIKHVTTLSGETVDLIATGDGEIDGSGLTVLPALIDPHVHFRVPGAEHKEDWKTAAMACIRSGITTVCDMPNNTPPCTTRAALYAKRQQIDQQLRAVGIPLRYHLYLGADKEHLDEVGNVQEAIAIKVFMGSSTGSLLIDDEADLEMIFRKARGKLIAVHAEDEALLRARHFVSTNPADHSNMRPKEAAIIAVTKALGLAEKYNNPLYLLHLSTKEEMDLVRAAKKRGLKVFAEVTPHHLFLSVEDYAQLGTLVQMNPPLRGLQDQEALWEALNDGTIDTIGTDHAPHTLAEKQRPYGRAPSGIPGVETLLPLMLDAVSKGRLTLEKLVQLTRINVQNMLGLPPNEDYVLVDLHVEKEVALQELRSKCGWTPYMGRVLKGWPIYTLLQGHLFYGSGISPKRIVGIPRQKNGVPGGVHAT